ncbi:MAG TPA: ferric reductase-like transmembrane domain-containing protein [Candidatus Saccharimonadales bacterium]
MRRRLIILSFVAAAVLYMGGIRAVPALAVAAQTTTAPTTQTVADTPDVLVPAMQGPSVPSMLTSRAKASWPWYITRAAGMVAAVSLIILLLSGVGLITGATFKFLEPLTAWATHRAVGIVFGVSVLVHILALLFDKFVPFNVVQLLVPFVSKYRQVNWSGHNLGSVWVALGILALYCTVIVVLTSLFWIDKKQRLWKLLHFLSYAIVALAFFHALFLGTDLAHGVFRWIWIGSGVAIASAIFVRLGRAPLR